MGDPLDPQKAIFYGSFVIAAYAMFAVSDTDLRPAPKDVPDGWNVVAWVTLVGQTELSVAVIAL